MSSNRILPALLPITNSPTATTPAPASATSDLAQPVAEYVIRVRNSARQLVGEISHFQTFGCTLRYNNVSAWMLELDANDPLADDLAANGAGIQVVRVLRDPATGARLSGGVLLSGPRWGRVRQMQGNLLTASGYDDLLWLQGRIAYPGTYNSGTQQFSAAYDARTGAAETVIRGYVNANAGSGAGTNPLGVSRAIAGLVLDTDQGRGASVTGNARFDQLVLPDGTGLLQQLAQSGGLGFTLTQSGTSLVFGQYVPIDRTATVIFSQAMGNLADFSYQEDGPDFSQGGNGILVGGGGQGAARIIIGRDDATSIGQWGLFEGFSDARDTSDVPTLQQRGDAALAQAATQTQFACTLAPQKAVVYGADFNVGDSVTVVIDGVSFTNIVREVQITLDTTGAETVVPAIGTPNADTIRRLFGGYVQQQQLSSLTTTANRLARAQ